MGIFYSECVFIFVFVNSWGILLFYFFMILLRHQVEEHECTFLKKKKIHTKNSVLTKHLLKRFYRDIEDSYIIENSDWVLFPKQASIYHEHFLFDWNKLMTAQLEDLIILTTYLTFILHTFQLLAEIKLHAKPIEQVTSVNIIKYYRRQKLSS